MLHLAQQLLWPLTQWAAHSQQQACRNAMVASTAIRAVRQERDEVQEFVDTLLARRSGRVGPQASPTLPAARLG
jgi:hypothetical protein